MAQLSDDCFAFGGELMRTHEALGLLAERLDTVVDAEDVCLDEADGRILAADIRSPLSVPPHDNAAVDGYAVRFCDLSASDETRLQLSQRIAAGDRPVLPVERGEAARIFTGAPMPAGADTVLMQEDCVEADGYVSVPPGIGQGANRRFAGEDIAADSLILKAGIRLRPQDIGLAASTGRVQLPVRRRLRVALFSTGNEVREPGQDLPPGCIYDANRYSLRAAVSRLGCEVSDLGILPDEFGSIRDTLAEAAGAHDLLMTSAGVSTGEQDHVRSAVEAQGRIHLWRLAIRPGRPVAFGQVGSVPFIGLPGNPVAVLVTFMRFARPAILRLGGCTDTEPKSFRVHTAFPIRKKRGRREWLRVRLERSVDGRMIAHKFARDGAGILTSMVESDGLAELPEELAEAGPGHPVDFLPFSEMG